MRAKQKEEILNAIRKVHGIATTPKDPIFSILTAFEIAFEDQLAKIDIQNMEFYAKLESYVKEIRDEAQNLAEVRLNKAVNVAFERLDEYKNEIEEVKPLPPEPKGLGIKLGVYYALVPMFAAAFGFGVALLIL